MPIRPENRKRYPKNWRAIRDRIVARAGNRCEGSPAHPDCRAANGAPHPITGGRVVLTVAHLDHIPENCDPANLRAWCQLCHNTYDFKDRVKRSRARGRDECNRINGWNKREREFMDTMETLVCRAGGCSNEYPNDLSHECPVSHLRMVMRAKWDEFRFELRTWTEAGGLSA